MLCSLRRKAHQQSTVPQLIALSLVGLRLLPTQRYPYGPLRQEFAVSREEFCTPQTWKHPGPDPRFPRDPRKRRVGDVSPRPRREAAPVGTFDVDLIPWEPLFPLPPRCSCSGSFDRGACSLYSGPDLKRYGGLYEHESHPRGAASAGVNSKDVPSSAGGSGRGGQRQSRGHGSESCGTCEDQDGLSALCPLGLRDSERT